jgi:hypothetical protein
MSQMPKTADRQELEGRLLQARRTARDIHDPVTTERWAQLVRDLEDQLR